MSFILLGILNSQAAGAVGGGTYDLLETTVLGSSASSVSFTGLGAYSDYKHLQIRYVAQGNRNAGTVDRMGMTFNGDTGAKYARHLLQGDGSTVTSNAASSQTIIDQVGILGITTGDDKWGFGVVDILDFSSSSKNTTIRYLLGTENTDANFVGLGSGLYNDTSAITSFELEPTLGTNFLTGSRFSLYGIRAA